MEYGSYSNNVEETRQVKLGARYCFKTDIDFAMLAAIPSEYRKKIWIQTIFVGVLIANRATFSDV